MPRRPSQEKPTRHKRTPLPPSILDQMEAMVRHPEFLRILPLQQSMADKKYANLTEEEEREMGAPRTKIRIAAIMEADDQWLSRSIQHIRKQGEAAWAIEAIKGPWGDETKTIPLNVRVPGDLPPEVVGRALAPYIRAQRQPIGLVATQRPRQHEVDKWRVYDLRKQGLTLWAITHRLFKLKGKTTYDPVAQRHYAKVRRAYQAACALLDALAE